MGPCSNTNAVLYRAVMMPPQQDRLLNLALDAVGDHVTEVCLRLLRLSKNDRSAALGLCNNLQDMYHSMIPYSLANEATEKLLERIDNLASDIRKWSKEPWREDVLQELIGAIIHPAVTTIELSTAPEHIFPFGIKWHFLVPLVYSRLYTLNKLKVLRLGRAQCDNWIVNGVQISDSLEEFTFIHDCNDKVLAQLASMCKRLKRVNVRESRKISDGSVETFLKMNNLEELNIVGTQITECALTRLLEGFSKRGYECPKLKSFGCSYITYNQLNFLVSKFPNLADIELSHCGVFDLSPLGTLKDLRKLSLRSLKFGQIQDLISEIGNQLISLELRHIQSMDVRFIGEHCSSLRYFHLFSYGVLQPPMDDFNREILPGFKSVVSFQFDCDWRRDWIDYILSQCLSVKKVDVTAHRSDTYLLLKHVLIRNPLKDLERLYWSPISPDGENIAKQLAEQCPNLAEVRGLCKNKMNYRGVHLS